MVRSPDRERPPAAVPAWQRATDTGPARMLSVAAALGLASGLVACGAEEPAPQRIAAPIQTSFPAASAGGACVFLDYDAIEEALGARFDVAAASQSGQTATCVVQAERSELPDLALTITKTSVGADIFASDVVPDKGATTVKGLGLAAYQATTAPSKNSGAGLEVCWLTKDKRLISLRYTVAPGEEAPPKSFGGKMIALAKQVEATKPRQP